MRTRALGASRSLGREAESTLASSFYRPSFCSSGVMGRMAPWPSSSSPNFATSVASGPRNASGWRTAERAARKVRRSQWCPLEDAGGCCRDQTYDYVRPPVRFAPRKPAKRRPPLYNAEDYASSLRDWTRRGAWEAVCGAEVGEEGGGEEKTQGDTQPSGGPEMSLREFSSVSHLLGTLAQDLQFALPSFVQEFVGDPLDGATLLLELLRVIQQSRRRTPSTPAPPPRPLHALASARASTASSTASSLVSASSSALPARFARRRPSHGSPSPSSVIGGGPFSGGSYHPGGPSQDERTCLECLRCCVRRAPDAPWRLAESRAGLHAVAIAIMSASTHTRVAALEVLTKVCEIGTRRHPTKPHRAHSSVSEALSSTRLSLGEPARFHFLVAMMSSPSGAPDLTPAGLRFVNAFLEASPGPQERVFAQAELQHAGFSAETILAVMPQVGAVAEEVRSELRRWQDGYLDVAALTPRLDNAQRENIALREKVTLLERRIKILQEEKGVLQSLERCLKERCCNLEDEVRRSSEEADPNLRDGATTSPGGKGSVVVGMLAAGSVDTKHHASTPEDEGISSTDNPSSSCSAEEEEEAERLRRGAERAYGTFAQRGEAAGERRTREDDEETTIEEVIRELRDLVDDEEAARRKAEARAQRGGKVAPRRARGGGPGGEVLSSVAPRAPRARPPERDGAEEPEIVPARILPQPPRRPRSLVRAAVKSAVACAPFFEDESSGRSSDSDEEDAGRAATDSSAVVVAAAQRTVVSGYSRGCGGLRRWETVVAAAEVAQQPHVRPSLQKALRRSESLHHKQVTPMPERWVKRIEAPPARARLDSRRGSLDDGLFFVADPSSRPPPPPRPSPPLRPSPPPRPSPQRQLAFSARARKSRSLDRMDDEGATVGDWSLGWDFPRGRPPLSRSATRRANPPSLAAARREAGERAMRCPPDGASCGGPGQQSFAARSSASSSYGSNNRSYATTSIAPTEVRSQNDPRRVRAHGHYQNRRPPVTKVTDLLSGLY